MNRKKERESEWAKRDRERERENKRYTNATCSEDRVCDDPASGNEGIRGAVAVARIINEMRAV